MSRSHRKTPITGNTTAPSEKEDKQHANRRLRRRVRQILADAEQALNEDVLPELRDVSNAWDMAKDGKHPFDPRRNPDLMRK